MPECLNELFKNTSSYFQTYSHNYILTQNMYTNIIHFHILRDRVAGYSYLVLRIWKYIFVHHIAVIYLECDGPLSWEVWEDRLPSREFPRWQPEMVALGEMESDWNVSQTTWSPFWGQRQQISGFFIFPSGISSRIIILLYIHCFLN